MAVGVMLSREANDPQELVNVMRIHCSDRGFRPVVLRASLTP